MDFTSKRTLDFLLTKLENLRSKKSNILLLNKRNIKTTIFNISKCLEQGAVEINESNIPLYYEFMSKNDISKYRNIIHFSFNKRLPLNIEDLLDIDKEIIIENWKYDTSSDGRMKSQSYFEVKDILKPLDEYIEEIKQSIKYQEYIKKID